MRNQGRILQQLLSSADVFFGRVKLRKYASNPLESESLAYVHTLDQQYTVVLKMPNCLTIGSFMWIWLFVVTILLILIRASREGHCDSHLTFTLCILYLPWCFEYDRTKYVRYQRYLRIFETWRVYL